MQEIVLFLKACVKKVELSGKMLNKHIYCLLFNKNSDGKLTNWSLLLIINLEKRYNRIPQKPQKIMVLNDNRGESINVMIRTPRIVIMMCGK